MTNEWMWLDWILIAVLALSTVVAWFRGFIREAISLITWIAAFLIALHFANTIGQQFFSMIHNATVRYGSAFLAIFFVILIAGMIINFIIGLLVKSTGLGFFDSFLGAIFGFIRGGCLIIVILMFLAMPWMNLGDLLNRSAIASICQPVVSWAMGHVPNEKSFNTQIKAVMPDDN